MDYTLIISAIVFMIYMSKVKTKDKKYINHNRGISSSDAIFKIIEEDLKEQKIKRIQKLKQILTNQLN